MSLEPRLREADEHTKEVFATARASLEGICVTGEQTPEALAAVREMFILREELGWAEDADEG